MKLASHRYGKARVRVMKVFRKEGIQDVKEIDAQVLLSGDFADSYTSDDNGSVVPTDTIKNTVHYLAKKNLGNETERFALSTAAHFLEKYSQVKTVMVEIRERAWGRMNISGKPHPHSFLPSNLGTPYVRVDASAGKATVVSGVRDLLIMKSNGSGFSGFNQCDLTTLKETEDRILATTVEADWVYQSDPGDYARSNAAVLSTMLEIFAERFSPSVQNTLFDMATAVLEKNPAISEMSLRMPNKHYIPIDLSRFGVKNENDLLLPTDEPHGQIEATVTRD